jgi:Domain of unknown function (DUF4338)
VKAADVIEVVAREARLKRRLRIHLKALGFTRASNGKLVPPALDKEAYRKVHAHQREAKLEEHSKWIAANAPKLIRHFASGTDINVPAIRPRLELAPGGSRQGDLFRLATMSWRIPVSEGYGRRLRFLVWDESNEKLIGLIALGDAVFNLRVRDAVIGWDHVRRKEALVHLMDAYVLGAVPPYNALLGGKLVASLVRSSEVVTAFDSKYHDAIGVISHRRKKARLVAVTTSSALGRSSMYNRLALDGRRIFEPIGYTSGWGHFHISDALFEEFRSYLSYLKDPYADAFSFGQGPNWRIRLIKRALSLLGMHPDLIQHGMAREVFLCSMASNAREFLRGDHARVRYGHLPSVQEVAGMALERWLIPRASRRPDFLTWRPEQFIEELAQPSLAMQSPFAQEALWTGPATS